MDNDSGSLLIALISLTGRVAFPPRSLYQIVCSRRGGPKQIKAYNLCDGTRTQAQIISECKLDAGNFSHTVSRWIESGVMFRLGSGREAKLLHLYPLPMRLPENVKAE